MVTLKEAASNHETQHLKNLSDLENVPTDLELRHDPDAEFPYDYVELNGERYVVKASVLQQLKVLLEENPKLAKMKVKKTGEGMNTRYTVIPLG